MKKKKESLPPIPEYDYLKPASAQDCTGLIPAMPENKDELENYEDLYPFLPQAPKKFLDNP